MLPATVGRPTGSRIVPVMTPPSGSASVSVPAPIVRISPSTVPVTVALKSPSPKARMSPVTMPATVTVKSPASLRSASVRPSTSTPVSAPVDATVTLAPLV